MNLYQELFDYMSKEHNVILLEADMSEIIHIVEKHTEESKLIDHFAGLAMQGEITRCTSGYNFEETAKTAYMMAKAMLKARKEIQP